MTEESLIKFPCDFTIKIMGKATPTFENHVIALVKKHYPNFSEQNLEKKFSKDKNFLSLSATVHATNKAELDALYLTLSSDKEIAMVL